MISAYMDDKYLQTKIKDLPDGALAEAIEDYAEVSRRKAQKLAEIYMNLSASGGNEALKTVLKNLEVDGSIEVLKGGS